METILLQINREEAYRIIEELEGLQLIKILEKNTKSTPKLSEKYRGKLSSETADKLQEYIRTSREEWR